jgi:hypothetical protein
MMELHKNNLLKGVKTWKLDFYKYCVLGKQKGAVQDNHTQDIRDSWLGSYKCLRSSKGSITLINDIYIYIYIYI